MPAIVFNHAMGTARRGAESTDIWSIAMMYKGSLVTSVVLAVFATGTAEVAAQGMKGGMMGGKCGMMGGGMMGGKGCGMMMGGGCCMMGGGMGQMQQQYPQMLQYQMMQQALQQQLMQQQLLQYQLTTQRLMMQQQPLVNAIPRQNAGPQMQAIPENPSGAERQPKERQAKELKPVAETTVRKDAAPVRSAEEQALWAEKAFVRGLKAEQAGNLRLAEICYLNAFTTYPDAPIAARARTAYDRVEAENARLAKR
jgi:hypothetical protein